MQKFTTIVATISALGFLVFVGTLILQWTTSNGTPFSSFDWEAQVSLCQVCDQRGSEVFSGEALLDAAEAFQFQIPVGRTDIDFDLTESTNSFTVFMNDEAKNYVEERQWTFDLDPFEIVWISILFVGEYDESLRPTQDVGKEFYQCKNDSDCIAVNNGCCGCSAGGQATAINADYEEAWREATNELCDGPPLCPAVMSGHESCFKEPTCSFGKCVLK